MKYFVYKYIINLEVYDLIFINFLVYGEASTGINSCCQNDFSKPKVVAKDAVLRKVQVDVS